MLILREFLKSHGYPLDNGIRSIMAWSAHGSLRRWMKQEYAVWTPTSLVAKAVDEAGLLYDPNQDIIYSKKNAWQHGFGYCYGYDDTALFISYLIDCEPVFFQYAEKEWMIELWKGQYGIETGCEIGVYNRSFNDNSLDMQLLDQTIGRRKIGQGEYDEQHSKFYKCVDEDEYLQIAFRVYRNGQELFSRGPEYHWWLTGFRWGVISRPEDLVMRISIKFSDVEMQQAFAASLQQMGYDNIHLSNSIVNFTFDTPHSFQPRFDHGSSQDSVFAANEAIVSAYCGLGLENNDPNRIVGGAGDRVMELISSGLGLHGRDFYNFSVLSIAKQVAEDIGKRLKDFFGIA